MFNSFAEIRPGTTTPNVINALRYGESYPFGRREGRVKGPFSERLMKFTRSYDGSDIMLKVVISALDALRLIFHRTSSDAPYELATNIREYCSMSRSIWGFFCIFRGAFHECLDAARSVSAATESAYCTIRWNEPFDSSTLLKDEERLIHCESCDMPRRDPMTDYDLRVAAREKYPTKIAKIVGFARRFFTMIEKGALFLAFAIFQPFLLADIFVKGSLSQLSKEVGEQFGIFYMVYHMTAFVGNLCDFYLECVSNFSQKMSDVMMKIWVNLCEISVDVLTIFKLPVHPAVLATLNLASSSVGFYRLWQQIYA